MAPDDVGRWIDAPPVVSIEMPADEAGGPDGLDVLVERLLAKAKEIGVKLRPETFTWGRDFDPTMLRDRYWARAEVYFDA